MRCGPSRPTLFALPAAAQLLLLVCANIANLLFARGLERRGELALREALGASRSHIVAQLVVEALPFATLNLVAGLCLAWWNFSALIARIPFGLPRRNEMRLDLPALLFGLLVAFAARLFFALAPALRTPARQLTTQLGSSSRSVSGTDRGLRDLLVGQFAVARPCSPAPACY
jgi:putative ABC transport system permease protein